MKHAALDTDIALEKNQKMVTLCIYNIVEKITKLTEESLGYILPSISFFSPTLIIEWYSILLHTLLAKGWLGIRVCEKKIKIPITI